MLKNLHRLTSGGALKQKKVAAPSFAIFI